MNGFQRDLGRIWGRCLELFGRIRVHEAFRVERLSLMIRATSSRSSRPNPLKDQGDSPKAPSPAAFGRFLGDLHSVATQASFSIALRSDFRAFGSEFGCLGGAKMDAKIDSGRFFCDALVERV